MQTILLSLLCIAGLMLGAYVLSLSAGSASVAKVLLALAGVIPFLLLREFARRFTLADLHTGVTLLIDVAIVALQVVLLGLLAATSWLSAPAAHIAVGVASGCVGLVWLMMARKRFQFRASSWKEDVSRGWALGRWFLVGQTTTVIQAYSVPWLLAVTLGLKAAGVFTVCTQIISFSNPVILGIGNILNPKVAWAFAEGGADQLKRLVFRTTVALALALGLFALFMAVCGGKLATLMFGAEYAGYGMVIAILGFGPLLYGLSMATGYGLTVVEKPHWHLITGVFGAVVTLGATLLLSPWGLVGAAWGNIAGIGAGTALRCFAFWVLPSGFDALPVAADGNFAAAHHETLAPLASGE